MRRAKETAARQVGLGNWLPTSLHCIERKSAHNSKHRFENLYSYINRWNLMDSYEYMNKRSASGIDGVTPRKFGETIETESIRLEEELKSKSYRTRPVKRVMLDKPDGRKRPLGLPVVRDKLVQTVCSRILSAIYEPKFIKSSFGYRKNRGAKEAVEYLSRELNFSRAGYVLELDIEGFFNNMDHDWLIKMLEQDINDRSFVGLIRKWLRAKVIEADGTVTSPNAGTPQGGVISPILSNIYLHYALDLWIEKKVRPHIQGEMIFCRYADDVVCSFQYQDDARRVQKAIEERLKKFSLKVSKEKTRLIRFSRFKKEISGSFDFLGFSFRWERSRLGKDIITHRISKKRRQRSIQNIKKWIKEHRHCRLAKFFDMLNAKMRGFYSYFGIPGNAIALRAIDKTVRRIIAKWLNRRSQRKSFNLDEMKEVFRYYNLVVPRIRQQDNRIKLHMC